MDKLDARKLTVEGHGLLRQMVIRFRKHSGMNVKELAVAAAHAAKRGIQPCHRRLNTPHIGRLNFPQFEA